MGQSAPDHWLNHPYLGPNPLIGAFLNQYRITACIGAGGMGEVFRGRDARLNRGMAIKVLPKDFTSDADRLRRFVTGFDPKDSIESFGISSDGRFITIATWEQSFSLVRTKDLSYR